MICIDTTLLLGLGLYALALRISELGGLYGFRKRSDGGSGTCFFFTIPYVPVT